MSSLQEINQQVAMLASGADKAAADLRTAVQGVRRMSSTLRQLLSSSMQNNYKEVMALLDTAQGKLATAAASLTDASRSGTAWLGSHGGGSRSPLSPAAGTVGGGGELDSGPPSTGIPKSPMNALSDYMSIHNYGQDDYETYSQDPQWRVLHRAAFPDSPIPPLARSTALVLLTKYMSEHHYGDTDYETYSQDPIWQELHQYAFPVHFARPDPSTASQQYITLKDAAQQSGALYQSIKRYDGERTEVEIINRLGGGDRTHGSCSSLAFAYAGNTAGYDILDFRDGESRQFFARNESIEMIANLPGVEATILRGRDEFSCTNRLLHMMEPGKTYYLATGLHAAVVRKVNGHFEYLELQHPTDNGWHFLDNMVLSMRFRCSPLRMFDCPNFLIDIDSLSNSQEFLDLLGFLNTAESEQHKGVNGYAR